jgi:hypothetical protein
MRGDCTCAFASGTKRHLINRKHEMLDLVRTGIAVILPAAVLVVRLTRFSPLAICTRSPAVCLNRVALSITSFSAGIARSPFEPENFADGTQFPAIDQNQVTFDPNRIPIGLNYRAM